jgi:hypothetical protein
MLQLSSAPLSSSTFIFTKRIAVSENDTVQFLCSTGRFKRLTFLLENSLETLNGPNEDGTTPFDYSFSTGGIEKKSYTASRDHCKSLLLALVPFLPSLKQHEDNDLTRYLNTCNERPNLQAQQHFESEMYTLYEFNKAYAYFKEAKATMPAEVVTYMETLKVHIDIYKKEAQKSVLSFSRNGKSPLFCAYWTRNLQAVHFLREQGCTLAPKDHQLLAKGYNQLTPDQKKILLKEAVQYSDIVGLNIATKADLESYRDENDHTLLHLAAQNGSGAAVHYLIANTSLSPDEWDSSCKTPYNLAKDNGHVDIATFLHQVWMERKLEKYLGTGHKHENYKRSLKGKEPSPL